MLSSTVLESMPVPRIVLPPLSEAELRSIDQKAAVEMRTVIGLARELKFNSRTQVTATALEGGTRVSILEVMSSGAKAVRLHITGLALPAGGRLYMTGTAGGEVHAFEGKGPFQTGDFWSPIVAGDTMRLEMAVPEGTEAGFEVAQVGHVFATGPEAQLQGCHLDAACYPDWDESGKAVAKITFNDSQFIYFCSAALLNNNSGDFSPLLLTAYHCVDTNELAKTVTAQFFYRSFSCNSNSWSGGSSTFSSSLLASHAASDASLLELLQPLPAGVVFAGWNAMPPSVNDPIASIHHPGGSYQRISFGSLLADLGGYPDFHHVVYSSGMGEPGSSGGPLFNSGHQVLGQLWGGSASCSNPSGDVLYGKLSSSYPQMKSAEGRNYLEEGLPDDRFAPNHDRDSAALLAEGINDNLVERLNYPDWFEIKPPEGNMVTIQDQTGGLGLLRVELFKNQDESPAVVGSSFNPILTFAGTAVSTNRYFLKVSRQSNSPMRVRYQVHVFFTLPPAPNVFSSVTNITRFSATLGAVVIPNQLIFDTEGWAEWGVNNDPATFTKGGSAIIPAGQFSGNVSVPISGLAAGTTYYFRGVARNVARTTNGEVRSFTTPATVMTVVQDNTPVGDVPINTYAERSLTVTNSGELPLTLSLNADFPGLKVLNNECVGAIAVGGSCSITMGLGSPLNPGPFPGRFQIISNAEESPKEIAFPFVSVGPRPGTAMDKPFTPFSSHLVNQVVKRTYWIKNWGNRDLVITQLTSDSPAFSATGCGGVVSPGDNCPIEVSFTPPSVGPYSAKIYVPYNNNGGDPYWFGLSATAWDIQLQLSRPRRPSRAVSSSEQVFEVTVTSANVAGEAKLRCEGGPPGTLCAVSPSRVTLDRGSAIAVTVKAPRRSQRLRPTAGHRTKLMLVLESDLIERRIELPLQ